MHLVDMSRGDSCLRCPVMEELRPHVARTGYRSRLGENRSQHQKPRDGNLQLHKQPFPAFIHTTHETRDRIQICPACPKNALLVIQLSRDECSMCESEPVVTLIHRFGTQIFKPARLPVPLLAIPSP